MCLSITLGGIQDSLLSTVNGVVQEEYEIPIMKIENLSSYPLLAAGVSCVFASVLARIIGKRPIYIASTTILLITVTWSAAIGDSYRSFFAARFISGLGLGSYEALVLSSIGDMYFVSCPDHGGSKFPEITDLSKVHQRGKRVAFLNLMSLGPINLAPVLSGYVAEKYTWRTNFWILTAFTGLGWVLIVFACPETRYNRPMMFETDLVTSAETTTLPFSGEPSMALGTESQQKRTYWQDLRPFSGVDRNSNPLEHLVCLFSCVFYPAVTWCFLVGSTYSGWVGE